jgi:hypothetical protein
MPRRSAALLVALALLAASLVALPRAAQLALDPRAIDEAVAIGQSRLAAEQTAFHAAYRLIVNKAPVDYIEIITPFRRVVLGAQARAQIGDRGFGQRQAFELLALAPDAIDFQFELTFHPLNTYIGVPDYAVLMLPGGAGTAPIAPQTFDRIPRFGARVDGMPLPSPIQAGPVITGGATQPMLGGTVVARFDGRQLGADRGGAAPVSEIVLSENRRELVRVQIDLAKLR